MNKWEYLIGDIKISKWDKTIDKDSTNKLLDKCGEDGWELVNTIITSPASQNAYFIFKKPLK